MCKTCNSADGRGVFHFPSGDTLYLRAALQDTQEACVYRSNIPRENLDGHVLDTFCASCSSVQNSLKNIAKLSQGFLTTNIFLELGSSIVYYCYTFIRFYKSSVDARIQYNREFA